MKFRKKFEAPKLLTESVGQGEQKLEVQPIRIFCALLIRGTTLHGTHIVFASQYITFAMSSGLHILLFSPCLKAKEKRCIFFLAIPDWTFLEFTR